MRSRHEVMVYYEFACKSTQVRSYTKDSGFFFLKNDDGIWL